MAVTKMVHPSESVKEVVQALTREHEEIAERVIRLRALVEQGDFASAAEACNNVKEILTKHVLDAESKVLRILIASEGRIASKDAIELFEQNRKILDELRRLQDWSKLSREESNRSMENLYNLLISHMTREELYVFPEALALARPHSH